MIEVVEKNSVNIDIRPYLITRGWTVLRTDRAKHQSPYRGTLEFNIQLDKGEEYEISYTLSNMGAGQVIVTVGGVELEPDETSGYYQKIVVPEGNNIEVYSDTDVEISLFSIKKKITEEVDLDRKDTIAYSQPRTGWVSFRSYVPDSAVSMYTDLLTFKNGELWLHTKEAVPNNFYGVQYQSKIKFPVSSVGVKTYNSIAVHSNKVIGTTENGIETELGDVSDLVTFDFTTREGVHYANILRDELTNNLLKGRYIVVELTDEETKGTKLEIFKVVVKSTMSTLNE